MKPLTGYALVETSRTGKEELALFDARLPIYWKRSIASSVNVERCNGEAEIVPVTIRRLGRRQAAKKAKAA